MEEFGLKINGVIFYSSDKISIFPINVTEKNYILIIKKLNSEKNKIIRYLKKLRSQNLIKSVARPKNRQIQTKLDELSKLKKNIVKDIEKIKTIYIR